MKQELKKRGLSTTGNKNELIDRLQNASSTGSLNKDNSWLDDPLDHDDVLLSDEELDEDGLLKDDDLLNPSPEVSKTQLSTTTPESTTSAKKVSLKRNLPITAPIFEEEEKKEEKVGSSDEKTESGPPKKVIKLTELTAEERAKIRAEKFGVASAPTSGTTVAKAVDNSDEKKLARAARFGLSSANTEIKVGADIETLKKRAERFGTVTAAPLSKVEQDEKLKKRQERFGVVLPSSTIATEKARQRLERFKTAA